MAAVRLATPLIVAAISLALILNVVTFSWPGGSSFPGTVEAKGCDLLRACLGKLPKLKEKDWKPIWDDLVKLNHHSKLFLDGLNRLREIFDAHEVPKDAIVFRDLIDEQIGAPDMVNLPCTDDNMVRLGRDRFERFKNSGSFLPRIALYRRKFLLKCNKMLADEMDANLANLRQDQRRDGEELANVLRFAIEGKHTNCLRDGSYSDLRDALIDNHDKLIMALVGFLNIKKQSGGGMFEDKTSSDSGHQAAESVSKVYEEHVIDACKGWQSATARIIDVFDRMENDYREPVDVRRKIGTGDMCQYIFEHRARIERESWALKAL